MNIQINQTNNKFPQFGNNGFNGFQAQESGSAKTKIAKEVAQKIFNGAGNPDTFSPSEFAKILGGLSTNMQNRNNIAATQTGDGISSPTKNFNAAVANINISPITIDTNAITQLAQKFDINGDGLDQIEVQDLLTSLPLTDNPQYRKGIQNLINLVQARGGSFTLDQLKEDMKSKLNMDTATIDAMSQKLFSKLDADGDGKVTTVEIAALHDRIKRRFVNSQQNNLNSSTNNANSFDATQGVDLSSLTSGLTDPSSLASLTGGLFGSDTSSTNSSSLGLGTDLIDTNTSTDSTLLG